MILTWRSWQLLSLWLAARITPARHPHSLILFTFSLVKPLTERNLFPTISSRNLYAILWIGNRGVSNPRIRIASRVFQSPFLLLLYKFTSSSHSAFLFLSLSLSLPLSLLLPLSLFLSCYSSLSLSHSLPLFLSISLSLSPTNCAVLFSSIPILQRACLSPKKENPT